MPLFDVNYRKNREEVMFENRKLEIERSEKNGIVVLKLIGKLLSGKNTNLFICAVEEELQKESSDEKKMIVIDMANVDGADSSGIGAIISKSGALKNFTEGGFILCGIF